jgi:sec-independent protein translocase protein TatA
MSIWHWVIVAIIVLLLFGKGRISEMMGDMGKGIKSFKKGLAEDDLGDVGKPGATANAQVTQQPAPVKPPVADPTTGDAGQR